MKCNKWCIPGSFHCGTCHKDKGCDLFRRDDNKVHLWLCDDCARDFEGDI